VKGRTQEEKDKTMNALHISTTWRRIRAILADMNYAASRIADPRVGLRH
jgi:hypothetical protein